MKSAELTSTRVDRVHVGWLAAIAIGLTFLFAGLYYLISLAWPEHGLALPTAVSYEAGKDKPDFGDALYFSVVTEATLGYGDVRPIGYSRLVACFQVGLGLLLAGIVVAKITSARGRELRLLADMVAGYWIEPFEAPGNPPMITFSRIYYDGDSLRYEGDNYDEDCNYHGYFRSKLLEHDGSLLKFDYSNAPSQTHLFESGYMDLKFSDLDMGKRWMRHEAKSMDSVKGFVMGFRGYRASASEESAIITKNPAALKELVERCLALHSKGKRHIGASAINWTSTYSGTPLYETNNLFFWCAPPTQRPYCKLPQKSGQ